MYERANNPSLTFTLNRQPIELSKGYLFDTDENGNIEFSFWYAKKTYADKLLTPLPLTIFENEQKLVYFIENEKFKYDKLFADYIISKECFDYWLKQVKFFSKATLVRYYNSIGERLPSFF